MPYFGRLTLARALADPAVATARSGAELVAGLDRLQSPTEGPPSAVRTALARRTFPRAIAWWGARLAEALQHAHERGVLHRDIKPSNVLLTDDGLPMLLDFNLASNRGAGDPTASPERVGGTLAYMAPEHLEALIDHEAGRIDHRSDIYSMGLVLQETLGALPISPSAGSTMPANAPFRLREIRRAGVPPTRDNARPIPPAFQAVLRRCLAPEPGDRYATAAELAADLQAVADGAPLRFTREPIASRVAGWVRQNRFRMALTGPLLAVLIGVTVAWLQAQTNRLRQEAEVRQLFSLGRQWLDVGDCAQAAMQLKTAADQAEGWPGLRALRQAALDLSERAHESDAIRKQADTFSRDVDPMRFHLLGFGGDAASASLDLEAALAPFGVLQDANWFRRDRLGRLDEPRRDRLIEEVNELLFIWLFAVGRDRQGDREMAHRAVWLCDRALVFVEPRAPGTTCATGGAVRWANSRTHRRRPARSRARIRRGPASSGVYSPCLSTTDARHSHGSAGRGSSGPITTGTSMPWPINSNGRAMSTAPWSTMRHRSLCGPAPLGPDTIEPISPQSDTSGSRPCATWISP